MRYNIDTCLLRAYILFFHTHNTHSFIIYQRFAILYCFPLYDDSTNMFSNIIINQIRSLEPPRGVGSLSSVVTSIYFFNPFAFQKFYIYIYKYMFSRFWTQQQECIGFIMLLFYIFLICVHIFVYKEFQGIEVL